MTSTEIVPPEGTTARILRDAYFFAPARRIGDVIKLSGQTGHRPDQTLAETHTEQIETAFQNATEVLTAAGVGWDNVDVVRTYHVVPVGADAIGEESFTVVHDHLGKLMPNHYPVWTAIAVPALSLPGMLIEIEVEAHA
ncbi:enamine deaminase RidA (YjgF/YER057c/UK114 family) [Microbacterium sp. BE35]|uniref:Rid family hydrolase n=1 Tax=Microbacterium sp. BE35 TaxID=2817773 RepID=UPI0028629260|nr:Rid family hydrolase [Microbacterium sp. BE35]MDR7188164.1 enamine deaminase RidA (YjgF/YER057c/UK114 family) [Microbacterium sp. BE35]